ncbi:MAG: hypothetical protein EBS07_04390 [Sphingobacteriia bacterium]|nr:hypothetical protein [Sphingobacteriia bacterium]
MSFSLLKANNINVTNISLVNQNTSAGLNNAANYTSVQFDLTWDNAWRNSAGPANWDAAWVFVKFQVFGQPDWQHATLSSTDAHHTITNTNGQTITTNAATDGRGVMIHLGANANTNLNLQGVNLRWMYRTGNVVHDTANVTVRVFAIEMVYIPDGQFFAGDGTLTTPPPSSSALTINSVGNNRPILISSEAAFNFIASGSSSGTAPFGYNPLFTSAYTLPSSFPKGYAAFYTMKYELSVQQFTDFFNCLRTDITTAKNNRNISGSQPSRSTFSWSGSPLTDATAGAGANRPQGGFSMEDYYTYADWSGLRFITELEYEKMCRGTDRTGAAPGIAVYPVNAEYAWGESANSVTGTANLTNDGTVSEGITSPTSSLLNVNGGFSAGPVRCGIFAAKNPSTNQRRLTGATYYGVMELTGNLEEWVLAAQPQLYWGSCSSTLYYYDGTHGDGNIDQSTGRFNSAAFFVNSNTSYPYWMSRKGGSYSGVQNVSTRSSNWSSTSGCSSPSFTGRTATAGFRGGLSASSL